MRILADTYFIKTLQRDQLQGETTILKGLVEPQRNMEREVQGNFRPSKYSRSYTEEQLRLEILFLSAGRKTTVNESLQTTERRVEEEVYATDILTALKEMWFLQG